MVKQATRMDTKSTMISEINNSTEFLQGIRTEEQSIEQRRHLVAPTPLSIRDTRCGTTSVMNISLPSEKIMNYSKNKLTGVERELRSKALGEKKVGEHGIKDVEDFTFDDLTEEDLKKLREDIDFKEEKMVSSGMANFLNHMRDKGKLGDKALEYSGRNKDKKMHTELNKFAPAPSDGIKLEYRGPDGRLMTQKEAFRYMCWIFHNQFPSLTKREREQTKKLLREKIKKANYGDSKMLKTLKKVQESTGKSYMEIK